MPTKRWTKQLVLVAAVTLAAAAVLIWQPWREALPVPVACPERWGGDADGFGFGGWVPAAADLPGVEESLVPGTPIEVMICAYPGSNTHPGNERLAGSRILTGGAEQMARDLAYLPVGADLGGCTLMGGPMTSYLIRFTYPDQRRLWVGSADEVNACVTTTNGTATSRAYVGRDITAAYRSGTWTLKGPEDPCRDPGARRGQNVRMVPDDPTSVLICWDNAKIAYTERAPRARYGRDVAKSLTAALNSVDILPSRPGCRRDDSASDQRTFRLMFGYPDGPAARVTVMLGCAPAIANGLLQADIDDSVRRQVTRLAPPQ
ncbi:hypothetical protein [Microtetraspora glauca]|uniref:Septum formation-related domain-containing protein n=1 Tax=Microtetraspora glauca TaxID=1996 RepID=A0ABV3GT43_MICGL